MERRLSSFPLPLLTPEQVKLVNNDNPFIRSIQNNLVVEHLSEFLFFEDLKALTLVSRDCLNSFRNTKSFSTRARFTIREPKRALRNPEDDDEEVDIAASLHVLQRSTYPWRSLSIELGVPGLLPDNEILPEHCLRSGVSVLFYSCRRNGAKVLADWLQFEQMLQRMEKLRELEIYSRCVMLRKKIFSFDDTLQEIFSKVDSLKIDAYSEYMPKFLSHDDHIGGLQHGKNLQPRAHSQLKKFCVKFSIWNVDVKVREEIFSSIVKIVDLKKDTLEEVQFHYFDVFGVEEMRRLRLPKLKRLLLRMDDLTWLQGVETFLQNQVPLEELQIRMEDFPLDLLQCLGKADKLGKIQRLCIQAAYPPPPDSWTFLNGMRKLKVVHFVNVKCFDRASDFERCFCPEMNETIKGLRALYPWIGFNSGFGSSCFDFMCEYRIRELEDCEHHMRL